MLIKPVDLDNSTRLFNPHPLIIIRWQTFISKKKKRWQTLEENYHDADYFNPLKYFLSLIIYKILYYKILYKEITDKYKAQLFRNVITFLHLFYL